MSVIIRLSGSDMERGAESIHACFPAETEGYSGSLSDELLEGTKLSWDSTSSGCFGWVRTCLSVKNDLDVDDDFYDKSFPEYTGDGTKHNWDWSTDGCFEWIRWVREKITASDDGHSTTNVEGDSSANDDPNSPVMSDSESTASGEGDITHDNVESISNGESDRPAKDNSESPVTSDREGDITHDDGESTDNGQGDSPVTGYSEIKEFTRPLPSTGSNSIVKIHFQH